MLCIFETFTAYAEYFMAINEEWETQSVAEKNERATRAYRAGMPIVKYWCYTSSYFLLT